MIGRALRAPLLVLNVGIIALRLGALATRNGQLNDAQRTICNADAPPAARCDHHDGRRRARIHSGRSGATTRTESAAQGATQSPAQSPGDAEPCSSRAARAATAPVRSVDQGLPDEPGA